MSMSFVVYATDSHEFLEPEFNPLVGNAAQGKSSGASMEEVQHVEFRSPSLNLS